MAAINGGRNALTKGRNAMLWDALETVNERVIVNAKDNEVSSLLSRTRRNEARLQSTCKLTD